MAAVGAGAIYSGFTLWRAILNGGRVELRGPGVLADGRVVCTADEWQRIGGFFTNPRGWLPPAEIREYLTDWITDRGEPTPTGIECTLVDLGLELSEPALRAWHDAGFAAPTDEAARTALDEKSRGQRGKLARSIAGTFSPRPPLARPGVYGYPDGEPARREAQQLQRLVATIVHSEPLRSSLARQASALCDGREPRQEALYPLLLPAARAAVHDRLAFYLHVLYGPTTQVGHTCTLTRYDPQAAAKPAHRTMLREGARLLAVWAAACSDRTEESPGLAQQISDAVTTMWRRRLRQEDPYEKSGRPAKLLVLVDLAVADVVGTAFDKTGAGASRWLAASFLDATVTNTQEKAANMAGGDRRADRQGPLDRAQPRRRSFERQFDEQLAQDVRAIVDSRFFALPDPLDPDDEGGGRGRRA